MGYVSVYKKPQPRGYSRNTYYIEDLSETSPDYFDIDTFPDVVGGGRYIIKLKGNGINLRLNTLVDIEIVDANGELIYSEMLDLVDRFGNAYIAFDIYDITAQGIATAYIVGEALVDLDGNPVPQDQKDRFNVRWSKQFTVFPFERNNAELIFNNPPSVNVAQVITPARLETQTTASAYAFAYITGSPGTMSIVESNFQGYDRDFQSSPNILDIRERSIQVDPFSRPLTTNIVPTAIRQVDGDMQNGQLLSYTSRYGTILKTATPFFSKQLLGGYFEFFSSESTPRTLLPNPPSGVTVSGSASEQLSRYYATVVEVVNSTQAVLSKPLTVVTIDSNTTSENKLSTHTYKSVQLFTGSITYVPSDSAYVTSSAVSESYLQFTFTDLNPISGQVYRIRTSTKLGAEVGDFKVLNDQIINGVEYLTDAEFPNGLNYARHSSDYRLIGHFPTQSRLDDYWIFLREDPANFDVTTGSVNHNIQMDSAVLPATYTQSMCLTTQFRQNYTVDQIYTLSFYLTLDPYTELEVYMNSNVLNTNVIESDLYPRAFIETQNTEKNRYSGDYSRFGNYTGKITNDRSTRKYYGKVVFDFQTDGSGFGRPLFRSRVVDEMNQSGSAYISEISIKPYTMNGFTPNIVQFAVPLTAELLTATRISQSIDFKIDYFDYTGRQSEYTTYIDDSVLNLQVEIPSNTCQADKLFFYFNSDAQVSRTNQPPRKG